MSRTHQYVVTVQWTGNTGAGTSSYKSYERSHEIIAPPKPRIAGSSDPAFRGDRTSWSPEDLLVASLSACHKLWYLHLCAEAGIVVVEYVDRAEGVMQEAADGSGRFTSVTLQPTVRLAAGSDVTRAEALHDATQSMCFIANSVSFPVRHRGRIIVDAAAPESPTSGASAQT